MDKKLENILIIDYGSQYTQLIARRIRELEVFCSIYPYNKITNKLEVNTFSILGFNGGECKKISKHCIHFSIDDMQISEDLQLIVCHICMQWLSNQL